MESSGRLCCAKGCGNLGVLPFPKNEAVRKKWELALWPCSYKKATKNSRLCVNHFKPTDFIHKEVVTRNNGLKLVTKILKRGVIPSICLTHCNIQRNSQTATLTGNIQEMKPQNLESSQHNALKKLKIQLNKLRNLQKPIQNDKKQLNTGLNPKLYILQPYQQGQTITQKNIVSQSGAKIKTNFVSNTKNNQQINENAKEDITLAMEVEEEIYPEIEYLDMEDFCSQDSEQKLSNNTRTNTNSSGAPKLGMDTNIKMPVERQNNTINSDKHLQQTDSKKAVVDNNNTADWDDIESQMHAIHSTKKSDNSQDAQLDIDQHFQRAVSTQANEHLLRTQVSHMNSSQRIVRPSHPNTLQSKSKSIPPVIKSATTPVNMSQDSKHSPLHVPLPFEDYIYSPVEWNRYNEERLTLHKKLKEMRKEYRRHNVAIKATTKKIKKWKNMITHPQLLKLNEKMAHIPKVLSLCQLRLAAKGSKGRRFNEEEKKLAKSWLEDNPAAYRFMLRIGFVLPSQKSLKTLQNPVDSNDDRDEAVRKLKERVNALKPTQRLCTLMFKEEVLSPENRKQKIVTTFDSENEVVLEADHALLFMVRSITTLYKEPVSYTFSYGPTSETELAAHIKNVITDLQVLGLTVVATVCTHTDTNRRAIQILIDEARCDFLTSGQRHDENVFMVNDKKIVTIFDPPHLLKGVRNHFMSKDLMYVVDGKSKVARWRYLEMVVKENPEINGERAIPKLTESIVYPSQLNVTLNDTKCAAQVFSQTVASYMGYLADRAILPPESQDTADLLLFFDQLFDSVNGFLANTNRRGKPLLYACKSKSPHTKKWAECIEVLQTMNFLEQGRSVEIAELTCWIWTLRSLGRLVNSLHNDYKVPKVWTRNLNQDMLERLFRYKVNPRKRKHTKVSSVKKVTSQHELPIIDNLFEKEVITQKVLNRPSKNENLGCWDGKVIKQYVKQNVPCLPNKENSPNCDGEVVTQVIINRPIKIDISHQGRNIKQNDKKSDPIHHNIESSSESQPNVTKKVIRRQTKQSKTENSSAARVEECISQNDVLRLPSLPMLEI